MLCDEIIDKSLVNPLTSFCFGTEHQVEIVQY